MYYVYVIKSLKRNCFYIGFTKNIGDRLKYHNKGLNRSTKPYKPFGLIFIEIVESREKTRDLEKFLKVRYNKEVLLKLLLS